VNPLLAALLAVAAFDSTATERTQPAGPPADSARAAVRDTSREVRRFPAVEVSAGRVHDLRSSATVHTVSAEALRDLPVTSLTQALALQPGVVAVGEDLHVRGGRAGETQVTLAGLTLNEPLRDRAPELPLLAVERADLLAGGLDAEYTGALAGVLDVHTINPGAHPTAALRWLSTGRIGTAYDWLGGRASTPLGLAGLGIAAAGEMRLDDSFEPQRPSRGRQDYLGRTFGWRNDNHVLGWAKIAPVASPQAFSLEVLGSRVVTMPYDPMISWNDSVMIYTLTPPAGELGVPTLDSMNVFYRAADHQPMTDARKLTALAQATRLDPGAQWHAAVSWQHTSELTSPGLVRDPQDVDNADKVRFGDTMDPRRDAFRAYAGVWPYFKRTRTDRVQAAVSGSIVQSPRSRWGFGGGVLWDDVDFYELDSALPANDLVDTLRAFHTVAPGGWAFVQNRFEREGLVFNGGLRLQVFSAGSDARVPLGIPAGTFTPAEERAPGAKWTFSPRLGLAFPVSVRDAMSFSYARIHQPPGREYLSDNRLLIYTRHPLGNPALEPSELVTYQAAVKHLFNERWAAQASAFHRDLYGQVGIVNAPYFANTFRPQYSNAEYGHATGIELALLAGPRRAGATGSRHRGPITTFLTGEFSLRYTFMSAYGTISGPDGWYYGPPFGARPLPTGEHPLDWDRGHMLGVDAVWREPHAFTFAWVTQVASGPRWTPTTSYTGQASGPLVTPDLSAVNSRQLPWTERTDIALRLEPSMLHGARLLVDVRNLFDSRGDDMVSVVGFPNPLINSQRDDYAGYRTETGNGGGAFWDDRLNGGAGGWVPVNDPRLARNPRVVRLGIEMGM
jgi:outer membrane receptor protein involved in Fe transport